jgi:hypothetical protein
MRSPNNLYEFVCEDIDGNIYRIGLVDLEDSIRITIDSIIVTARTGANYIYPISIIERWSVRTYSEDYFQRGYLNYESTY